MNTNINTIFLNYKVYIFFFIYFNLSLILRLCKVHLKNEKIEQIIFFILNLKNFTSILHKFLFYVGWRDRLVCL